MITYTLKEEAENTSDTVVVKGGQETQFTLREIEDAIDNFKKSLTKLQAEKSFYETIVSGYETSSPEEAKIITDENVKPFFEFAQAKYQSFLVKEKISSFEEAINLASEELNLIKTTLNLHEKVEEKENEEEGKQDTVEA